MEHTAQELNLSKEELKFNELIRNGDDFMKISIYRNARDCYKSALESHINDSLALEKLTDCEKKIKYETKIIVTIVIIAAVIIGTYLLTSVIK